MSLKVVRIVKRFERKLAKDYNSVMVGTEVVGDVEIDSSDVEAAKKLQEASQTLAKQARIMTFQDYNAFLKAQNEGKAV